MGWTKQGAKTYLDTRSLRDEVTGCLVWQLSCGSHGYGQTADKGSMSLAHRMRWWAEGRCLPKGRGAWTKKVLHTCDNRRCNEITHLFLGTDKDNSDDKIDKGRAGYGPAHSAATSEGHRRTGYAPLPRETVRLIFSAAGRNKDIGRRFGTSKDVVCNIKNRRSYKWDTRDL